MKTKNTTYKHHIISAIAFLMISLSSMAQPLPPSSPTGNPVPVDGVTALLVATLVGGAWMKLRKRNNDQQK